MSDPASLLWLRRDLRRADHPALVAAAEAGTVHPVFVLDPVLWAGAGPVRRGWLAASVLALRATYGEALGVRLGDPGRVIPALAARTGAAAVHVSTETTPYGRRRDAAVRAALPPGVAWIETGSPYAVTPGRVRKADGTPYQVFTPFAKAWRAQPVRAPAVAPADLRLAAVPSDLAALQALEEAVAACPVPLPPAGEQAASARWAEVLPRLGGYATDRDRPDRDGTSRLSPYLKVGALHPRTLLADLHLDDPGHAAFAGELAWREFYADVLASHPASAWHDLHPLALRYDESPAGFAAWREGRTGYPIVDAGMRQLAGTGWMHNRVRMITASFLAKDLHLWWPAAARHFLDSLLDGDLAANSHGWQWVAGTGTDAAPYFRVFNPVAQGRRFDPEGDYVRRWVPELAHLTGAVVHEPWTVPDGLVHGYPAPIVDHAEERRVALERYAQARAERAQRSASRSPAPVIRSSSSQA